MEGPRWIWTATRESRRWWRQRKYSLSTVCIFSCQHDSHIIYLHIHKHIYKNHLEKQRTRIFSCCKTEFHEMSFYFCTIIDHSISTDITYNPMTLPYRKIGNSSCFYEFLRKFYFVKMIASIGEYSQTKSKLGKTYFWGILCHEEKTFTK